MKKGKGIEYNNGMNLLPEAMIQHIQSFLTGKEAARTSLVSKFWLSAWLTRPSLYFDDSDFQTPGFEKFVTNTMQRYQHLNLNIDSFSLRLTRFDKYNYYGINVNELALKSMKMGAAFLNLEFICLHDFGLTTPLPKEVLGFETLVGLSLSSFVISGKVGCSKLKYLELHAVEGDHDVIQEIFSSCPLLQKLSLSSSCSDEFIIKMNSCIFHNLKCLLLERMRIPTSFFNDFSSKFPSLKELAVHDCDLYERIRLRSTSLESVSFKEIYFELKETVDIPSLRKLSFRVQH